MQVITSIFVAAALLGAGLFLPFALVWYAISQMVKHNNSHYIWLILPIVLPLEWIIAGAIKVGHHSIGIGYVIFIFMGLSGVYSLLAFFLLAGYHQFNKWRLATKTTSVTRKRSAGK